MIIACPECAHPYELADGNIAALVQVACPHCDVRVILDFEAANEPSLRAPNQRCASACLSRSDYEAALAASLVQAPSSQAPARSKAPVAAANSARVVDTPAANKPVAAVAPTPVQAPAPSRQSARPVAVASQATASTRTPEPVASNRDRVPTEPIQSPFHATPEPAPGTDELDFGSVDAPPEPVARPRRAPTPARPQPGVPLFSPISRTPVKPLRASPSNDASQHDAGRTDSSLAPPLPELPQRQFDSPPASPSADLRPPQSGAPGNDSAADRGPPKTLQFSTDTLTNFIASQRPEFGRPPTPSPGPSANLTGREEDPQFDLDGNLDAGDEIDADPSFDSPIELTDRLATQPEIHLPEVAALLRDPANSQADVSSSSRDVGLARQQQAFPTPTPNAELDDDIQLPVSWGKRIVLVLLLLALLFAVTSSVLAYLETGSPDPLPFLRGLLQN